MGVQFAGNILVQSNGGPLPISQGGTGQTTAPTALNALLPTQTGQSGKVLVTNGSAVSWSSATMTPGGADTNIQFNDSGSFGGSSKFVINKTTGALTSTSTFTSIGLTISDSDALNRTLRLQTLGSDRWLMMANNTTEAGAASGSDFALVRVADNGATSNIVYQISRATGVVDFKVAPTLNGSAFGGTTAASALTGTTLASNVVSSSLTSVGTLGSLNVSGAAVAQPLSGQDGVTFNISAVGIAAALNLVGGAGGNSAGGAVTITAGSGYSGSDTNINGGAGGFGSPGNVVISSGSSISGSGSITLRSGTTQRLNILGTGAWSVGTNTTSYGTSGQVLTSNGNAAPTWQTPSAGAAAAGTLTGTTLASNVVTSSLTSVGTLSSLAVTGTITSNGSTVGYLEVPQLSGTSFTLSSSGKHFFNTGASTSYTIPANDTIAYPVGTAITFVNQGSGTSTIAIATDTLYLAGTGTTGTRTLGIYGFATALKITATSWIISGTGLT